MFLEKIGDQDILYKKSGGHWAAILFGLIFLSIGLVVFATGVGLIPLKSSKDMWINLLVGIIFSIAGSVFAFGRYSIVIDMRKGTAEKYWRLFFLEKRKIFSLEKCKYICIKKEDRGSGGSSGTARIAYPVQLTGTACSFEIDELMDYIDARQVAEQISKFLHRPIHDESRGADKVIIREAGRVDESIRERANRTGEKIYLPEAPEQIKSSVRKSNGGILIDIPPLGFTFIHISAIFSSLLFYTILIVISMYFWMTPILIITGIGIIFFIGITICSTRISAQIEATHDELKVIKQGVLFKNALVFPSEDIEELFVDQIIRKDIPLFDNQSIFLSTWKKIRGANAIVIRSDEETIEIGGHLDPDESEYLCTLIKSTMIKNPSIQAETRGGIKSRKTNGFRPSHQTK